ncbi:MAG: deoxyribose-phosphate aldolase [Candidatus Cloacimonetes bacterium]|nr:deoxyribose-phosphate aldolase [Candidatus Cloacimonadota bacterium]
MNLIKEIALKIFPFEEYVDCKCNAQHEICLQCNKCRAMLEDQIITDFTDLSPLIDHTNLRADANHDDIINLCEEANEHNFRCVCINPCYINLAKKKIKSSDICSVVGFPLGANIPETKIFETERAIDMGTNEIDMVLNIAGLKLNSKIVKEYDIAPLHVSTKFQSTLTSQNSSTKSSPSTSSKKEDQLKKQTVDLVEKSNTSLPYITKKINEWASEIALIASICNNRGVILKVIIETCLLTNEDIILACLAIKKAGADFVKTSTGFSTHGAEIEKVQLIRAIVGTKMGVKASGGIKTKDAAISMLKAGANRIGSSCSVQLIMEN